MRPLRSIIGVIVVLAGHAVVIGTTNAVAASALSSCGTKVTTDAVLTTDLTCSGQSGVIVGANNITIDLAGHTLTGDRTGGHHGIDDSSGFDGVTVKHGTVEKFFQGLDGNGGSDAFHVSNVVASGNVGNGIVISGVSARVSSTQASGNGNVGISISGVSARVSSSQASGNHDEGIHISGASARVSSFRASANALDGIHLFGSSTRVSSSVASGNGGDGIFISGSSARVSSSEASGNSGKGISIDEVSARVSSSRASANVITGIEVIGDAPKIGKVPGGPLSDRNRADANGFSSGASDGSGLGISATGFTTAPVGRNEARGNDDPAQCSPASLC